MSFAELQIEREERDLAPWAARSYPANRRREEEDCGLRTPLQRDRDRIVHSKAFRRLKHKTQVFVSPQGDHYRTRLTHTLEVTGISRTVARALRLNEDLVEAIGLGHDLGHPPFGHIGEDVLDRCLRERFGGHFHHWEQSLRLVDVLERDGAGLNLNADVRDGILGHSGRAAAPRTLEGAIVRITDRFAYLNHDIDDALRAGVLSDGELPREAIAVLGETGSRRIDALVHDLVERSELAREIVQGEEAAAAMGALRDFMFERVYLGEVARREHSKVERVIRTLFDYYCERPEELPAAGEGELSTRVTDYISGMTDRYCIRAFEALAVPRAFGDLMPRYTDDSRERVRDAVDIVELIGARTELRRSGSDSYTGLCPFHEERTPSFSVTPSKKVYYCFGCQASGDAFTFVQETQGVDFPGALELLAERYNVPLEIVAEDERAAGQRRRHERLYSLLERTCAYYERCLWESPEAAKAREYLAGRGLDEDVLRRFRVGWAPSPWDRVLLASRRGGFTEQELLDAGLVQRSRDQPGRVYDCFRARITFPLCDRRGRVVGFGARTLSAGERAKYVNTAEGELFHKRRQLFGLHLARAAATKAGRVVLCEGYTDVLAMHQAGVTHCVGLMGTALTDDQLKLLADLAPVVVLALDADGAGQAAMLKAAAAIAALGRVELRVAPLAAGSDPADVLARDGAASLPTLVDGAIAFVRFRVERIIAAGDASTPEGRDKILGALGPVFAELGPGSMREDLEREVAVRLRVSQRTVEQLLAPRPRGGAVPAGSEAPPPAPPDSAERSERAFLELCIALPGTGRELLAAVDLDALFASPLTRRAAERLREEIDDPLEGVADDQLVRLLTELSVRASTLSAIPAQLEVARRQLDLARIERAIDAARAGGTGGVTKLSRERAQVKREIDEWMAQALEETGAGAR